jgi:hypothetical protein
MVDITLNYKNLVKTVLSDNIEYVSFSSSPEGGIINCLLQFVTYNCIYFYYRYHVLNLDFLMSENATHYLLSKPYGRQILYNEFIKNHMYDVVYHTEHHNQFFQYIADNSNLKFANDIKWDFIFRKSIYGSQHPYIYMVSSRNISRDFTIFSYDQYNFDFIKKGDIISFIIMEDLMDNPANFDYNEISHHYSSSYVRRYCYDLYYITCDDVVVNFYGNVNPVFDVTHFDKNANSSQYVNGDELWLLRRF